MFVLGNAIEAIAQLIALLSRAYVWILMGAVICSWVQADPRNPIVRFLRQATYPVMEFIGRFVPPVGGMDISPLIAILVLQVGVEGFLVRTLVDIAHSVR